MNHRYEQRPQGGDRHYVSNNSTHGEHVIHMMRFKYTQLEWGEDIPKPPPSSSRRPCVVCRVRPRATKTRMICLTCVKAINGMVKNGIPDQPPRIKVNNFEWVHERRVQVAGAGIKQFIRQAYELEAQAIGYEP